MQILRSGDADFNRKLAPLLNRVAFDPQIEAGVATILADVRRRGDAALSDYAQKYDGVSLTPAEFAVSKDEIAAAASQLDPATISAVHLAVAQVRDFARMRLPTDWRYSPRPGVILGERFVPLSRIGAYVPGGTAPLLSTVVHTVTLAATAGVKEIVVITPPGPDGKINPAILYAAQYAGATEIYRLGGVYGIGALAFGSESVRRVEKIVGPGNAYVTAAKRQVYGFVALDLVAGPSEIMIIADADADARFIAADMLSQAEHGSGHEQAVLITTSVELLAEVVAQLKVQRQQCQRQQCLDKVLDEGTFLILVDSLEAAAALASDYAPEHLEIMTAAPEKLAKQISAAGAIFLGPWTPEPVGDFVAGPSHVLPTGGAARFFSGLSVEHFCRRMSVVNYDRGALVREIAAIEQFAAVEGLDAHGRSASVRLQTQEEN